MRILHVLSSADPRGGGVVEGITQLHDALTARGHQVHVVSCDAADAPWVSNFQVPLTTTGPAVGNYGYTPRLVPWLLSHAGEYDGVVSNGLWQFSSLAVRSAMIRLRRPYTVYTHGMLDPYFRRSYPLKHLKKWLYWPWAEYRVLRDAAAVIFTCEEERILARGSFPLYRANERVAGYGTAGPSGDVNLQRSQFLAAHPELEGKRLLLFLSRIHLKKGCDLLIRAFARCASDPSVRLVMAGPDQVQWRPQLEELARSCGVADRICWPGMLSGDLKWGAFHACEAFILPSHQENFGIVVAEALACGKPALISDKVNIWREVEAEGAGLVEEDTEQGTFSLIERWLTMEEADRLAMAGKARSCFDAHFEIGRAAENLVRVLEEVRG